MGAEGEGLTCGFPQKWMSADGLTLWSVFSVYGEGGKKGINAHDRFNLVKATLKPASWSLTLLPALRKTPSMCAHQSQLARRLAGAPSYLSCQDYDESPNV
jgi:hypothetical protein